MIRDLLLAVADQPVAEKVTAVTAKTGTGIAVLSGGSAYFGLSPAEWNLIFAAGGFLVALVFGAINTWIKYQHLRIAEKSD